MIEVIGIAVNLVVAAAAAVLGYAATRPGEFRVQRTTTINAPPEKIFAFVNDLHRHGLWSPWEKKDSAMRKTYSGAESGVGAVYEWDGNRNIGKGRMEITEAVPPSRVTLKLDFIRPFEGHNTAEFTLHASGGATDVSWAIHGPSPLLSKVFGLFCSMDKMIGREFEIGLANLKALAEAPA